MKVLLILLLFLNASAYAQLGIVPDNASSGAIIQSNIKPYAIPQLPKPNDAQPSIQSPLRELPPAEAPVEMEPDETIPLIKSEEHIFIRDVVLENGYILPSKQVEAKLTHYRNKNLSFTEVQTLADELTALYVTMGFLGSQVYIPPQTFENNLLILRAVEVKVSEIAMSEVQAERGHWFGPRAIFPRLSVQAGDHFNINALSRNIRLINDNPDIKIQAVLLKGNDPGTTKILLQTKDKFPIHATPFWDNLGRDAIGKQRFGITSNHNNALGFGDTITNSVNFTRSSFGLFNQYLLPVGPYGTQLGFDYAHSRVRVGGELKPLQIESQANIFSPFIRQAFWKNGRFGLTGTLAFDFMNLNTDLQKRSFQRDRIRVLRPALDAYINDRWGRTYINQEVNVGLDVLGGLNGDRALSSKQGSGTKFVRLNGSISRIQKLPLSTTGVVRARYQYSPNRLLSAQQLQLGGTFSVRGYNEGLQIGDKGYVLNAEWYVPSFIFPARAQMPFTKIPLREAIKWVGFTDFGQVLTNNAIAGESPKTTLLSSGVGVRVQLTRFIVGRLDLGFPLLRQENQENSPKLHFGLQSTLF